MKINVLRGFLLSASQHQNTQTS
ncbi:protein sok, partial [Klebsiella pneumoniae]|nr:protein sok [Klebsiella pneumoniae]